MERLAIAASAHHAIVTHAREAAPHECCGLLIGTRSRVESVWRARNLEDAPSRFLVDPADHFEAIRRARACGQAVVGFYHSHPVSEATPSERDLAEASYAGYIYLIASLRRDPPEARAYRFEEGRFREVDLVVWL